MTQPTDTDTAEKESRIDRRSVLKLTGSALGVTALSSAGITSLSAGKPSNTVDLGDEGLTEGDEIDPYLEEHWVEGNHVIIPGGTYEWNGGGLDGEFGEDSWLEGDGEVVLEGHGDKVGDMVAENGAHVRYQNITIPGEDNTGGNQPIWAADEDAVIEMVNYNRPDGGDGRATGLWQPPEHAGTARFINCTVMGFDDNGLYGSAFAEGGSGDGMGKVEVYGGYYAHNGVNELRIGGDGSKIIGAVCVTDRNDSIRIREAGENIVIRDVDMVHTGGDYPFYITNHKFEGPGPNEAVIENCRIRNETDKRVVAFGDDGYDMSGQNIHLTGGGDYDMDGGPYDNVYTGAEADEPDTTPKVYDPDDLSSGGSTSGSSTSDTEEDTTEEESSSGTEHTLTIQTVADSGVIYSFTVDGTVQDNGEGNDSLTENGDGTYTAEGETGHGFADEWTFTGSVTAWSAERHPDDDSGEYSLLLDGEAVTPEELTGDSGSDSTDDSDTTDDSDSGSGSDASSPSVDRYEVTEAGSANPHVDIVADWQVSDADGDLSWALVQIRNAAGFVVDASKKSISGETAAGVDYFQIQNVDGQTFDVEVTVTDGAGNTTSATKSVTE